MQKRDVPDAEVPTTIDITRRGNDGKESTTRVYLFPLGDAEPPPTRSRLKEDESD